MDAVESGVRPAQLPEEFSKRCFCPSCGEALVSNKCADPWAICLACKHGHRFFIPPDPVKALDSSMAASLEFNEIRNLPPGDVAVFWLSDPAARSKLNPQLAGLLRTIIEARGIQEETRFSFCPICGDALEDYDLEDIWVRGLRCPRHHHWAERGGCLYWSIGGRMLRLDAEYSDDAASQLIGWWLRAGPDARTNLHESVRRVLTNSPLCPRRTLE
jgi:hypothetical protein